MPHQELYNKIFTGKSNIANPKEFLQDISNEYPYFSLAHFFLLKESSPSDFNYRKIAAKTAIHFNNPFLLQYQLNRRIRVEEVPEIPEVPEIVEVPGVEEVPEVMEAPEVVEVPEVTEVTGGMEVRETEVVNTVNMEKAEVRLEQVETVNVLEKEIIIETADKPAKKEELLFEPLHTTDYFASQGIKLSEEVQAGDKLGKQLRSFTDWLKTMKKLHHGKLPETSASIDLTVQNLAEKSNKEDEILTESMADVFIQQGKKEKALDIYQKLSLLNPAKSAYFAAKIEFLKEN